MNVAVKTLSIALATLMLPAAAFASSEEDQAKFAKDVEQKCTEATASTFKKPQVAVDPTGSESYGLALVFGRSKEAKGPAAVICVYDKKTQKVEVGGEMGKDLVRVRKPKPDQDNADGQNKGSQDDDDQQ